MRDYSSDSDIWDKVNGKIVLRRYAAAPAPQRPPKPVMEWPSHYPPYPVQNPDPIGRPRPKPGSVPPRRQDGPPPQLPPRQAFPPPGQQKQPWTGRGSPDPYRDPKDRDRLLKGAYSAGLSGDEGARASFPPGSPFMRAYEKGLRDRAAGAPGFRG